MSLIWHKSLTMTLVSRKDHRSRGKSLDAQVPEFQPAMNCLTDFAAIVGGLVI